MYQKNYSQKSIAQAIGKHPSVVSRELKRNSDERNGVYRSDLAQRKCQERHKKKTKHRRFTEEVKTSVEVLLRNDYSPEQVVGILKKEGNLCVSHERIYQHIWADNLHTITSDNGKEFAQHQIIPMN